MNPICRAALPLALVLGMAGCASAERASDVQLRREQGEDTALGHGMLNGLKQGDFTEFSGTFSAELKTTESAAAFRKLYTELDVRQEKLIGWKMLDSLDRGGIYQTEVWKVSLERKSETGSTVIDRLFYVTKAEIDGKPAVIGFKFDTLF